MASPGRNDPCPCGSGRKYKHCCLAKADTADQLRVRVRRAEGRVVDALLPFALDQYGKTFFEQAWLEFWAGEPPEDAEEFTDVPEFENMFVPWFVTSFVADPADQATHPGWPAVPVGLKWLETRTALDSTEREWLVAACASPMSLFVVEATDPGRSLDIRDVLTGRQFHVLEQRASQTLKPNHLYFTRVVSAAGVSLMFGAAPYPIPPQFHLRALEWRDTISGRQKLTREDLVEFDVEIRNLYHSFVDELLNPPAPRLRNTDGDDLSLTTMVYELRMSVADAFERLRPLATLPGSEHISDVVEDESGAMTGAVLNWVKAGNKQMKSWNNTILGTMRLEAGKLTADVNSERRADRLAREIKRRLGDGVTLKSRTAQDVSEHLQARAPGIAASGEPPIRGSEADRPPELDELEDALYVQHLEAWIDTRIPALGNRTPRQAAKSVRGRERIEAILAGVPEGPGSSRPAREAARNAMRQTLGLPVEA